METINPAGWYSYMGSGMPVAAGNKKGQVRNGSVFAGNMGGSLESRIGQKMAQAGISLIRTAVSPLNWTGYAPLTGI